LERQIAARVTEIKRQRRFENERTQRQSSEQTQANLDF
jgi:hypothetical protein